MQNIASRCNSDQYSRVNYIKANSQTFFTPNIDLISACNLVIGF